MTTAPPNPNPAVSSGIAVVRPPTTHQLALMIWLAVFPTLTVLNLALGSWLSTLTPIVRIRARDHRRADRHLRADAAAAPAPQTAPDRRRQQVTSPRTPHQRRDLDMSSASKTTNAVVANKGNGTGLRNRPEEPTVTGRPDIGGARAAAKVPLWQLNLLRVGYLVMGGGLVLVKWPLLFTHGPWELKDGTVECMLVAMSVLALMGLRHPLRMLPILLFEVAWKLTWLGIIAAPLWLDGKLDGATRVQTGTVLWVVIIIAAIPWRHVLKQYVMAPGDPWRRSR